MIYWDVIHGTIDFSRGQHTQLILDLLEAPEVQRLRHMRLMNFDVPWIQDLASARRYPHSIGTCYLADVLAARSYLPPNLARSLVAAALIHDIGILPYGHLVETFFHKRNPEFSHEMLVRKILFGTYHRTNIYHQILPSLSLQVARVLQKYRLDVEFVLSLINPPRDNTTAISADIDLDNIDNIHRMGALMGYPGVRSNLGHLLTRMHIGPDLRLAFSADAAPSLEYWLQLRRRAYETIIGHPACVSYNAFLSDLVETAIANEVITEDDWFISDADFEARLIDSAPTRNLARQLVTGCHYTLYDYVWLRAKNGSQTRQAPSIEEEVRIALGVPPLSSAQYFVWEESKLIARVVRAALLDADSLVLGDDSSSVLVALVNRERFGRVEAERYRQVSSEWRDHVVETLETTLGNRDCAILFPEDYKNDSYSVGRQDGQLSLF